MIPGKESCFVDFFIALFCNLFACLIKYKIYCIQMIFVSFFSQFLGCGFLIGIKYLSSFLSFKLFVNLIQTMWEPYGFPKRKFTNFTP